MKKKGFTLVELMVVVAIIALLAAIAFPMYSTFRQKNRVATVLNGCAGVARGLQSWYEMRDTFSGITVSAPEGGSLMFGSVRVGVGLARVKNVTYNVVQADDDSIRISWAFSKGCPSTVCNGYYEVTCDVNSDRCSYRIRLDAANTLGYNN